MSEDLAAVQNVTHSYGSGAGVVDALRSLSFNIQAGEFVAISGPSGSGKSTLLNLLGILDQPTHGDVVIGGVSSKVLRPWERCAVRNALVGFVFQSFHLLSTHTAGQNVELPMHFRATRPAERRRRSAAALEAVGLGDLNERLPGQLSGGQQQRVSIARALVTEPTLLLCDEPTGNLDRQTGGEVVELLAGLPDTRRAVVVVTHDEAVAGRASRRIHLVDGRVAE